MTDTNTIEKLSFEGAMGELEKIVRDLESGQAKLDESITSYERGTALKNHCEKLLKEAQLKIEKISLQPDGTHKTETIG
ncbi:MAG: exodeoxyribonuclease VII small subunit [Alphaproteobacteria bacterium]|nr:exodeoxyribonuclease VII small subunit [Alphaproteobacteria bacterium]